jgi:hypothetical protein
MSGQASELFFYVNPPRVSGQQAPKTAASTNTGTVTDLWAGYGGYQPPGGLKPKGRVFVTFEAKDQDITLRLQPTNAATTITLTTGVILKANQPGRTFYLEPFQTDLFVDHIAAAVGGTLMWYISSPIGERTVI